MPLMVWTEDLSVQVEQFDHEHRRLIAMVNSLADSTEHGWSKDVIQKTLEGLADCTRTHFAREEKLFDRYAYPDAAAHKAEHAEFVAKVARFQDKFRKGSITLGAEVLGFLSDWLLKHIQGSDREYRWFFDAKGVTQPAGVVG